MNSNQHKVFLSFVLLSTFFINGCSSLNVIDIKQQQYVPISGIKNLPNIMVGVKPLEIVGNSSYRDAEKWQQGLVDVLREKRIFKSVSQSRVNRKSFDLIIRGTVNGNFRQNGSKNFFTWWPGPIFFAQGWRGTQFIYDAQSDIEVVDAKTKEVLGIYHAESSYQLSHRSYNPWHLFGALMIIPGIIKGAINVDPRANYRELIYQDAYPNLWEKISNGIVNDLSKIYSHRMDSLKKKCGDLLNQELEIGMVWSEFVSCQTQKYRLLGQETRESGTVSVYLSDDKSLRVHVDSNNRVVRWFVPRKRKQSAAVSPGRADSPRKAQGEAVAY